MTKSLFVTATGTDIGKTYISGLLVKRMREYGYNCGYYKPILSGGGKCNRGKPLPGDCVHVVNTAGLDIEPIKCLSYCFEDAVSPHLAAKRAGINIDISKILTDYNNLEKDYDYMVIEGAGGITCPIIFDNGRVYLMNDLIKDMGQDVIVVADGGLGTINSILTTVEYIKNRGINIEGIILNNYDSNNYMHVDNLNMIEHLAEVNVVATVGVNDKDLVIDKQKLERLFK